MPKVIRVLTVTYQNAALATILFTLTAVVAGEIVRNVYNNRKNVPKIWKIAPVLVVLLLLGYKYFEHPTCHLELGKEYVTEVNETEYEQAIAAIVNNGILPAARVQHEKAHGCVVAEFEVQRVF